MQQADKLLKSGNFEDAEKILDTLLTKLGCQRQALPARLPPPCPSHLPEDAIAICDSR